ncbi:MAG: glycosyltransferase family 2 protein [bacterium]|nr:glycosyltransferase family 2 protein [bacterium]
MITEGKIDISIVIISYNTEEITKNCLDSILKSLISGTIIYEIIIVDNASTDTSLKMLEGFKKNHSHIKIISNKENVGFAKANNQAVQIAKGSHILFLNSDIVVLDDAITALYDYFNQHEHIIHFLGGKLLNKDESPQASCGPFYSLPVIFGALFLKGDYWGLTRYSPNKPKKVDWVSGACILTKKIYYEQINGFDENIFMYMDEIDLLYRANKIGYETYFYPNAKFIHLGSASSNGKTYPILQVFRGFIYFYRKHHNTPISIFLLKCMLQLKSWVALVIGKVTCNHYLIETYEKAYKLAQMA